MPTSVIDNQPASRNRERGSTLIDILFGTVLIGIVVTALFLSFSLANRITLRAKHVAIAKETAATEIEKIRRTDFNSLLPGTTNQAVTTLPNGQMSTVLAYFDPPANEVISVTVTITWRERQGSETFTLTTLATEGGTGR